jgi:hypothetical protein
VVVDIHKFVRHEEKNKKMKNILKSDEKEARKFLLKRNNYSSISLPIYFNFEDVINKLSKELTGKIYRILKRPHRGIMKTSITH